MSVRVAVKGSWQSEVLTPGFPVWRTGWIVCGKSVGRGADVKTEGSPLSHAQQGRVLQGCLVNAGMGRDSSEGPWVPSAHTVEMHVRKAGSSFPLTS